MANRPTIYLAYLLRLWRSGPDSPWRASLEDPQTGERMGFSDLGAMLQYLQRKTEAGRAAGRPSTTAGEPGLGEPGQGRPV